MNEVGRTSMHRVLRKPCILLILVVLIIFLGFPCSSLARSSGQVYAVSLNGEITPAMSAYVTRQIELANLSGADGVILKITTLGGLVISALEITDSILESDIPVVVYIENRAESAGALIAVAAETIIMAPGSHMGSAEPVPYSEKAVAAISGEFRKLAEKRGRDPLIAAGMADKNLDVPGFPEGRLVDLTAREAKELGYTDAVLSSVSEVLEFLGWDDVQLVEVEPDFKVRAAQFLTSYEVSSILLTIAIIAMIIEIFMQGFGVPGAISIIAFALYFGGGFIAGNTEWWSLILFVLGIVLFIIEFAVPGFGVFGISGIIAVIIGIIFAAPTPLQGITTLGISLAAAAVLIPILYKLFGGPRLFQRLVLHESETADKGYISKSDNEYVDLIGKTGKAVTPLRPSGTIVIDGERFDVLSDGSYLSPGTVVRVVDVQGSRITVTAEE